MFALITAMAHSCIAQTRTYQDLTATQPEPDLQVGLIFNMMQATRNDALQSIIDGATSVNAAKIMRPRFLTDHTPGTRLASVMHTTPHGKRSSKVSVKSGTVQYAQSIASGAKASDMGHGQKYVLYSAQSQQLRRLSIGTKQNNATSELHLFGIWQM
jgi:hypothetical protein